MSNNSWVTKRVREHLKRIGIEGGRSRSEAKRVAARVNLAKANAAKQATRFHVEATR
jgi:hypothetical protein